MLKIKEMTAKDNQTYNTVIVNDIDNFLSLTLETDPKELGEILPSDREFYKKLTQHIMPDDETVEEANGKILDLFLKAKADKSYELTDEQMVLLIKFLNYIKSDAKMEQQNSLTELLGE